MIYRTRNYIELEGLTPLQRKNVGYATHRPHELVERAAILLYDFIDRYLSSDESRKKLATDAELFPEILSAHLNGLLDTIDDVKAMLSECQGIEEHIEK